MRDKPRFNPLVKLFRSKAFTDTEGMNWLQERGHISDNCVNPEDVAMVDVINVLNKANAQWAIPKKEQE